MFKKRKVLANSSSGGLFYEFANLFLNSGGVVYGAAFDENFSLRHIRRDCIDALSSIMTSKYLQSNTEAVFSSERRS